MDESILLFTENAETQLDDLLRGICAELQLPEGRYEQAVDRYETVCRWLEGEGSALRALSPLIYPQGSMRIGTTVKPIGRDEHDLDFVCEFRAVPSILPPPLQAIVLLLARLRQHQSYAPIVEMKNRCVRLNYANEFHMDILPAFPDPSTGINCLTVPDRESQSWKPSNPKGYADWFENRCSLAETTDALRVLARAEPIPAQQTLGEKETLKKAVQLIKRWRDIRFQAQPDLAPISMVLTTLAAEAYRGEVSVVAALSGILSGIVSQVQASETRIYVLNPGNPFEDLSERWDDSKKYRAFVEGIQQLHEDWTLLVRERSIPRISQILENLFGSPVEAALVKQARRIQALRGSSALRVGAAGLISSAASNAAVPVRANTFHGE